MKFVVAWVKFAKVSEDSKDEGGNVSLKSKNDSKSHTDRQSRRDSDCDKIQKLDYHILSRYDIV